ncbi:ACP S-malonyltransferase [Tropheryma whipplei]|uniref:ACP S-malonyltransferase n=1 Tax=Tropheryma whipplei TaxID=2039 RepID=UPI0004BAF54D|nr:ACP S-malonyltransferase [Tropheryma whipplei]
MASICDTTPEECAAAGNAVITCPGQGAQKSGLLNEWLDLPGSLEFFQAQSDFLKIDLIKHGTISDTDILRDTRIAQPLIVALGIFVIRTLQQKAKIIQSMPEEALNGANPTERIMRCVGLAGHSVGEITAAFGAGVLTEKNAMRLVKHRANQMYKSTQIFDTGMVAVLGQSENLEEYITQRYKLFPANYNCPGQIVFAGLRENLDVLLANPPEKIKVIPLQVAGAFHTRFMRPAVQNLKKLKFVTDKSFAKDPDKRIWTNYDGSEIFSGSEYVQLLIDQIARPVRWDLCQKNFENIDYLIELPPAGTLTGLARRSLPKVKGIPINTIDDLEEASCCFLL